MKNKAVFIDRDGTMARDAVYCSKPEDFELFPGTAAALKLLRKNGFKLIVITNQSGIGRKLFDEKALARVHEKMVSDLAGQGASVDGIYYCPHIPEDNCRCRKPQPELVYRAVEEHDIDLKRSYVVGDLPMDIGLARNVGCKMVLVGGQDITGPNGELPDAAATDLLEAAGLILKWDSQAASGKGRKKL